jgi:uncharacterized protein (TIGR03083 family)
MAGTTLLPSAEIAHLEAAAGRFSATLGADLETPVPSCPGWDLRALASHLGGVHRWARSALTQPRPDAHSDEGPGPDIDVRAWFDEGARDLVTTLHATDPAAPCWTFGPKPRTAAFWFRRQAHETSIHAWDAEQATSGHAAPFPLELSLDGIDEVITMLVPRQVRLGRLQAFPHAVDLRPADARDVPAWRLGPADRKPDGVVTAAAATMLLLLWRRVPLDVHGATVTGDADAVRAVLAAPLTP